MVTDDTKSTESAAIAAQRQMVEQMKRQLEPEFSAARQVGLDPAVHGRAVGALPVPLPILKEGELYRLKADNGAVPVDPCLGTEK